MHPGDAARNQPAQRPAGESGQHRADVPDRDDGAVEIDACSKNCPEGAQAKIDAAKKDLIDGKLHVFDTSKFTVNGEAPSEENMRPGNATWANLDANQKFLEGGYYHESEYRSAPFAPFRFYGNKSNQ